MLSQEAKPSQAAQEEVLRSLMQTYATSLVRLCYAWLGDAALAEDAVQETFLKAWRHWDSFRACSSEKTWLTRIAINTCKDMRRTRWFRHLLDGGQEAPDTVPIPPDTLRDDTVSHAISELPEKDRQIVLLHYYQGFTLEETRQVLGISLSAVNSRLMRARGKLRDTLRGWYFDED